MLGAPVLGVNTSIDSTNGSVQAHNESYFLLNETDAVNFTSSYALNFMPKAGGILGNLDGSTHQQVLVSSGSNLAATWQYEDAQIYYFSDTDGHYDSDVLQPVLQDGIARVTLRSTINCTVEPELIDTTDLVKIERLIADRGEIYSLALYVWRNP